MIYTYEPKGVCSKLVTYDIEGNTINSIKVDGGCHGNLQGVAALLKGMNVNEAINRLKGIDCRGRGTSCPDQISLGLEKYLQENKLA